jgi:hypothetical protein
VIITGSKFFTGPPFSGALLVPPALAGHLDAADAIPPGLLEYSSRCDWPRNWSNLRSRFPVRSNFGQWLRWEAALEEIGAYYRLPSEFRRRALKTFGKEVERIIAATPSLVLLPQQTRPDEAGSDDEELSQRTIFPFMVRGGGRILSLHDCRALYRALSGDAASNDSESTEKRCLIGQPVALGHGEKSQAAALRISASARLVSDAFSPDEDVAGNNLRRAAGDVATVVKRLERLLADRRPEFAGVSDGR